MVFFYLPSNVIGKQQTLLVKSWLDAYSGNDISLVEPLVLFMIVQVLISNINSLENKSKFFHMPDQILTDTVTRDIKYIVLTLTLWEEKKK